MIVQYRIAHNVDSHYMRGFQPGDRLIGGFAGTVEVPEGTAPQSTCDVVWSRHNRDDRPDGQQAPSLSVGDVVRIYVARDGVKWRYYTCEMVGFSEVPEDAVTRGWHNLVNDESFFDTYDRLRATGERAQG